MSTAQPLHAGMPPSREELDQLLRGALRNIHDYVYLQNHPLAILVAPVESREGPTRAQRLRRMLLEAVERLAPARDAPLHGRQWRGYHILTSRYVEGQSGDQVRRELALSERQYYREHQAALQALTGQVWERLCEPALAGGPSSSYPGSEEEMEPLSSEIELMAATAEPIDLAELVLGVRLALLPLATRCRVTLTLDPPAGLPAILSNRTLLRQVYIQLLSTLLTLDGVREVELLTSVARRRIWTVLMVRTQQEAQMQAAQLGQALDQARYLVTHLRGEWQVGPNSQGAFVLRIGLPTGEPRLVLAVEDNPGAVELVRRYLGQRGYRVVHARSGHEALALARQQLPDVITLDIMLPGQDGWEILQEIKGDAELAAVPVILASVLAEPALAAASQVAGYLRKPFSQQELLAKLEAVLGPSV